MARSSKKIGLALGSGGARGWAHFGVLRALDEAGIRPDVIAGTSAGAMVGAFYAAGRIRDLYDLARHLKWKDALYYLSDLSRSGAGLVDGRRIELVFRGVLGHLTIEELPIPFAAVATDVRNGLVVHMRGGDLVSAVRASISIPGIFAPIEREGRMLVDGGLVDPIPVSLARAMGADVVIAVNVLGSASAPAGRRPTALVPSLPDTWRADDVSFVERLTRTLAKVEVAAPLGNRPWLKEGRSMHVFDVLSMAIRIMEIQIAEASLLRDAPDVLLRPGVGDIDVLEFHTMQQSERAGYDAAVLAMGAIRNVIGDTPV